MRRAKDTIGSQLKRIERLGKKRHTTGLLYSTAADLKQKGDAITVFTMFVSDENTYLIRPHVFSKKSGAQTPQDWEAWLARNYGEILRNSVLPGMNNRTGKFWRAYRVIGFVFGEHSWKTLNANNGSANTKTRRKRRKAE